MALPLEDEKQDLPANPSTGPPARDLGEEALQILGNIGQGFLTVDPEFRIAYINPRAEEIGGRSRGELAGQPFWDVYPGVAGTDAEGHLRTAMAHRVVRRFEFFHPPWHVWFRSHAMPAMDGGLILFFEDITEQRETDLALRKAERFFTAIAEHSPDCIKILDCEGRIIWMSPKGLALMEIGSLAEIEGRSWIDLWPDGHGRDLARAAFDGALRGESVGFEECCPTLKGHRRWWNVALVSLPESPGDPARMLSISRDVTERRQIEARLRESEERFRNMADHAPVMIWIAGEDGLCSYLSRSWYEFTGLEPTRDKIADWATAVHPDDLPEVEARLLQAHRRRSGAPVEYRARRHDGEYRWLLDAAVLRHGSNGKFAGYIGSMTDITDGKTAESAVRQSEELFRTLANSIPQLAWMAHPDGRIFWFNQRWYDYTGSERGSADAENWRGFHGESDGAAPMEAFDRAIASGSSFQDAFTLRRADGEYLWHLCQVLPIRDDEGQLRLWFGTHTDITEERDAQRRKDQFLATLAHELRNPIAPILTGLEVIRSSSSDASTIAQVAAMMERQAGQMVHLIDDLLDMSRINTGKIVLKRESVELGQVIRSAVEASQPVIQQYNHEFVVREDGARIAVDVDPHRLSQVVSNLLSNAAKYTPPRGRIELAYGLDAASRPYVTVSDNGKGIDPSRREVIFKLFEQEDSARQDGLGIGLTLVQSLVDLHGGTIEVESDGVGKGSRFTVRLPVISLEAPPPDALLPPAPQETTGLKHVLVVDDGKSTADILAMFFELEGREVTVAYDGVEALEAATARMPELILMDLGMPRMDGFEAARRIRLLPGGDRVTMIALSGWGQEKDKLRSHGAGFDDHLIKPVSPADLRALMERLHPRP
ncbi:PAS domain S-box protein [Luteolibacter sp. GHJ8]|uniref:histidine kinase n=1 Tax=Luteolibacter rhizosphaerae TaxID=2989719 RepID=A0ABT3FWQ6_9BACT|nr:PAS domain S-box protein [Luteolibacter rhizosphaerae]MCW1912011.1 PAS domain S-box protein [Luteolibacter rhizosphaerae]